MCELRYEHDLRFSKNSPTLALSSAFEKYSIRNNSKNTERRKFPNWDVCHTGGSVNPDRSLEQLDRTIFVVLRIRAGAKNCASWTKNGR